MLDHAAVSMPPLRSVDRVVFETGDWDFDTDGYVHLTRTSASHNRLTFAPDAPGATGGVLSFRYRTRWAKADEQVLTVFFGERQDSKPAKRFAISFRSNGAVTVERQRLDGDRRLTTTSVLAQAQDEGTNEIWRTYRIEVHPGRARVTVGDRPLIDATLPEGEDRDVGTDGTWGVDFERAGGGNHRTQAVLGGLVHQRFSPEGNAVSSAHLVPDGKPTRAEVQFLNMKYAPDRSYWPRAYTYLIKTARRKLGDNGRELIPGLFAPAGSAYRYRLSAGPGDTLRARYGFDLARSSDDSDAVTYFAEITTGGQVQRFYERTVSVEAQKQRGDFFDLDIELPLNRESTVELLLGVSHSASDVASAKSNAARQGLTVWGRPVILSPVNEAKSPPNVILISVDTLRPDFIGPFDRESERFTPNLSAFGQSAVKFTEAFTVAPWTLPAHFSLFTGRYPSRHGLNRAHGQNKSLADGSITTLAEVLSRHGYVTAAIASDHSLNPDYGVDKGFGSFVDETVRDAAPLIPAFKEFVEEQQRQRFFLFFHSYDLHAPLFRDSESSPDPPNGISYGAFLEAEPTETEKESVRRLYRNHARYYDARFGELIAALQELGLYEDSVIVVTADHGEELFEHGNYLHGHALTDEVLRVPLLVKFPSDSDFPLTNGSLTALIDVMPSLLEYLGIPIPPDLDGRSFMPVLAGRVREQRRHLFAEALAWGPERKAVRTREYKYIRTRPGVPDYEPRDPMYDSMFDTREQEELYKIADDREEQRNVVSEHPDLAKLFRKITDPLWEVERRGGGAVDLESSQIDALRTLGYVR